LVASEARVVAPAAGLVVCDLLVSSFDADVVVVLE
jgi:hypothetical protein